VVWLLGKVQSGKTTIIRSLTQASEAEVGTGFRACTRASRVFDFPAEAPIIRFLDTRGLGEVAYEPGDDIAFCEQRSQLILAVLKALDTQQQEVVDVIGAARKRHPEWPVVVAQTCLHEAYAPGQGHVLPYPFSAGQGEETAKGVPEALARSLAYQRALFKAVPGRAALIFVPIDFTPESEGLEPADYGRQALIEALMGAAPAAVAVALAELTRASASAAFRKSNAHILGYAMAAAASDVLPVAGAVVVPMVQAAMMRQLARLHRVTWDRRAYAEFMAALGASTLLRVASSFGLRQLVKLVPVYGQTAGAAAAAAASFATTYAVGKAASYFLARRQYGAVRDEEITTVYRKALRDAFRLAEERDIGANAVGAKP
jgi:uncharacterized protein (DUF697 family)